MHFDDDDFLPKIKPEDIKKLNPSERHAFIDTIYDDYKFTLSSKMAPQIIRYYRDVLVDLVKTYGH